MADFNFTNATHGLNRLNMGLINLFENGITTFANIANPSFEFDPTDPDLNSCFVIDTRGRNRCGFYFETGANGISYQAKGTTIEYNDITELVSTDFDISLVGSSNLNGSLFGTRNINLASTDGKMATAVALFFQELTSGTATTIEGGIRTLNKL